MEKSLAIAMEKSLTLRWVKVFLYQGIALVARQKFEKSGALAGLM